MFQKNRIKLIIISITIVSFSLSANEAMHLSIYDKNPKKEKRNNASKNKVNKKTTVTNDTLKNISFHADSLPQNTNLASKDTIKKDLKKDNFMLQANVPIKKNLAINTDTNKLVFKKSIGSIFGDSYARILKKNGDLIVAAIKVKTTNEISFVYPLNTIIEKIDLSEVSSINYSDGTLITFNTNTKVADTKADNLTENKVNSVNTENKSITDTKKASSNKKDDNALAENDINWELVEVTDSIDKASGLVEVAPLEINYTGSISVTNASLEKSSEIILKKKAAHIKASLIVITDKKIIRQYGELPSILLKGTAYSKTN